MSLKAVWGAKTTVAITLTSLANNAARESTVIDFGTLGAFDAVLRITTKGQASSASVLNVYAYAALGDTTYTDGATGSDASFTAANILNAKFVDPVQMNTTNTAIAVFSLAKAFDGVLPAKVGLIVLNKSGDALSTTGSDHVVEFQALTMTVV